MARDPDPETAEPSARNTNLESRKSCHRQSDWKARHPILPDRNSALRALSAAGSDVRIPLLLQFDEAHCARIYNTDSFNQFRRGPLFLGDFTYDIKAPYQDVKHQIARFKAFKKNDKKLSIKVEGRPWVEHKQITKQIWVN